ncbi:hypothetical protein JCM11641_005000 [Rhodosporidiobolus odoratus]
MTKQTEEHILYVDGDRVTERDPAGHIVADLDYARTLQAFDRVAHNKKVGLDKRNEDAHIVEELRAAHDQGENVHPHVIRPVTHHFAGDDTVEHRDETHDEQSHRHRQVGQYRHLLRDSDSKEVKKHAKAMLKELGEEVSDEEDELEE